MSTIIEREKALLKKLHDTNYEFFDNDKEDALRFIEDKLSSFVKYSNIVIKEQIMTPIWRDRLEGQDYRDAITNIDRQRRITHDSCIGSVNQLNRMSAALGLEPFADIDTSDRYQVAEFIGQFVNEVYNKGIGNEQKGQAFDKATYVDMDAPKRRMEYDEKYMQEQMAQLDRTFDAIQQNGTGLDNQEDEGFGVV